MFEGCDHSSHSSTLAQTSLQSSLPVLTSYRLPVSQLAGAAITQPNELVEPVRLAAVGSHLLVIDAKADSSIWILDAVSGAVQRRFGKGGTKDGGLGGIWSFDGVWERQNRIWGYDFATHRMLLLAIDAPDPILAQIALHTADVLTSPVWVSTLSVVSPGLFKKGRLAAFDAGGKLLAMEGDMPARDEGVPPEVISHAYQSSAVANPARTLVVLASRHADRVDIMAPDGRLIRTADRPFGFNPVYGVSHGRRGPVMVLSEDTRFGYLGVVADSEVIVALFSGKRFGSHPGTVAQSAYVHVFDWNGSLKAVVVLDAEVSQIALGSQKILYGLTTGEDPQIRAYDLNHVLRRFTP